LPEGSVLLIGSVSHLMEEGLVGYVKCLGAEFRRFSKLFDFTVHVIPFIPPPVGGTNDPDLVSNLIHITTWLEKTQRWNISQYYGMLRQYVISSGRPGDLQPQKTQRHKMPTSFELFGDYVMMCHPISGLGCSLPRICPRNEQVLITKLLTNLSTVFKWDLDVSPLSLRGGLAIPLFRAPVRLPLGLTLSSLEAVVPDSSMTPSPISGKMLRA
jgi:hypothetical protein